MTAPVHHRSTSSSRDHSVSFSERDIADATRLLTMIVGDDRGASTAPPVDADANEPAAEPDRLKSCARALYDQRQKRITHFGPQMFGEPAWEMLLILYLEDGGERQSQRRLVELSGASRSTASRWIDHLVRKGLAKREDHPTDKRRNFVTLSGKGRSLLEAYLSETCA